MLSKMTTGAKIFAAMTLAAVVLAVVGLVAWRSASAIESRLDEATNQKVPSLSALGAADEGQMALVGALWELVNRRASPKQAADAQATVKEKLAQVQDAIKTYESMHHGAATLELWGKWKSAYTAWVPTVEQVARITAERRRLLDAGKAKDDKEVVALDEQAWASLQGGVDHFEKAEVGIEAVKEKTLNDAKKNGVEGIEAARSGIDVIVTAVILCTLLLLGLAWYLARQVGGTVRALVAEAPKAMTRPRASRIGNISRSRKRS